MERLSFGEYEMGELVAKLVDCEENWPYEAAARLVCEHGKWLRKPEFYRFITTGGSGHERWAGIDWPLIVAELEAGTINGSDPDLFVLKMGASMAAYFPISLRDDLRNQSEQASVAMMRAVGYLAGLGPDVDDFCPPDQPGLKQL